MKKIENAVLNAVIPILSQRGLDLWDVVFEKEGAYNYLRILFDKPEGLDSDDVENVTAPLNAAVDALPKELLETIDYVDCGTPGLMRLLRTEEHLRLSAGKRVKAKIRDGGKSLTVTGVLGIIGNDITIGDQTFDKKSVIRINLDDFEPPQA